MTDKKINPELDEIKPFTEMTSTELFVILTGGRGVMPQMYLQDVLKEYLKKHKDTSDLVWINSRSVSR